MIDKMHLTGLNCSIVVSPNTMNHCIKIKCNSPDGFHHDILCYARRQCKAGACAICVTCL